jgi:hypothetical protein
MIRYANKNDINQILELGEDFFKLAGWPKYCKWDSSSVISTLTSIIDGKIPGILIVAEEGIECYIVGIAAALIFPFYFNFDVIVGQELFWYVDILHRAKSVGPMMEDFLEKEAKEKFNVSVFIMASVSGLRDEALARMYKSRGYDAAENTFIKRL